MLAVEGLTRRYGDLVAVDDLSLKVVRGRLLGLLGPNGAGKTTTIMMIAGLLRPDSGRLLWDGAPIKPADLRHLVGVCPQEIQLWARLTCAEQMVFLARLNGLSASRAKQRTAELLEAVGLAQRRTTQARRLSGGMQRRLNLAMALVNDPALVVLDEPEAGRAPQSRVL
ncbi:MAG: ABC transporter ATP-binding protein, partial [Propionibacteriaceae bacterium]|nr:ABC transporter ATP-binding protein [Propionibacteriaceae bacterium]